MKKILFLPLILCLLVTECSTFSSRMTSVTSADEIEGLWKSSDGSVLEFPFELKEGTFARLAEPEKNDTRLWFDYMQSKELSFAEVWSRRYALLSEIYGEKYPYADETGLQTGIKLRLDQNGNVFSARVKLIPDNEFFAENIDAAFASDASVLYAGGKAFVK